MIGNVKSPAGRRTDPLRRRRLPERRGHRHRRLPAGVQPRHRHAERNHHRPGAPVLRLREGADRHQRRDALRGREVQQPREHPGRRQRRLPARRRDVAAHGPGRRHLRCALDAFVRALTANGTDVYVGTEGSNVAGIAQADHVAKWNGSAWSAVGSKTGGADGWFPAGTNIYGLASAGPNLFATGTFQNANGDARADNVAWFDGTELAPARVQRRRQRPVGRRGPRPRAHRPAALRDRELHERRRRHPGALRRLVLAVADHRLPDAHGDPGPERAADAHGDPGPTPPRRPTRRRRARRSARGRSIRPSARRRSSSAPARGAPSSSASSTGRSTSPARRRRSTRSSSAASTSSGSRRATRPATSTGRRSSGSSRSSGRPRRPSSSRRRAAAWKPQPAGTEEPRQQEREAEPDRPGREGGRGPRSRVWTGGERPREIWRAGARRGRRTDRRRPEDRRRRSVRSEEPERVDVAEPPPLPPDAEVDPARRAPEPRAGADPLALADRDAEPAARRTRASARSAR